MFPEYREQIAHLRATDRHFSRLFEEHNLLDHEVQQLESKHSPAFQIEIDALKKQKLALKEQLYSLLRKNKQPAELRIVNGKHEWPVWESTVGDALKYVFRTVRRPQADQ